MSKVIVNVFKFNVLTLQGRPSHDLTNPNVSVEFSLHTFFRQFALSEEVDQDKIETELKDGVLNLHLPKAEKAKPKQIEVKVG